MYWWSCRFSPQRGVSLGFGEFMTLGAEKDRFWVDFRVYTHAVRLFQQPLCGFLSPKQVRKKKIEPFFKKMQTFWGSLHLLKL